MFKEDAIIIKNLQKAFLKNLRESFCSKHTYLHKGLKIVVSGRIRGSRRKKKMTLAIGRVTPSSLGKNLQYWEGRHHSLTGTIGFKLYKS
jgi:ribosomal protein S3